MEPRQGRSLGLFMTTWSRALDSSTLDYNTSNKHRLYSVKPLTFGLACCSSWAIYPKFILTSCCALKDISTFIQQCNLISYFRRARGWAGKHLSHSFKEATQLLSFILIKPLHPAWMRKARIAQENPFSWYTGPGGIGPALSQECYSHEHSFWNSGKFTGSEQKRASTELKEVCQRVKQLP